MNRLGSWLLLTLCIVSLLAVPMMAQKSSGTIRGVVTDPSGAVLANIPVVITNTETGQERTVTTNTQGEYIAPEIAVGTYSVTVKAPNFKESVSKNVDLHTSSTQTLNIQLQVGSTSEQVTVAASEVQVQTDNAALGEVVTGEQVRELPLNGRSFVQLTQLQPGVSAANNFSANNKGLLAGVDFSVNGNATTNNLFLVDGANNNDVGSNRTILIYPSIEAISEFKMLRNSYGPEYGQASGAVINIVTRSGSNQWHGDVLYFGRNTALNAYEYFAHANEVASVASGNPPSNQYKNVVQRNDFGFSLGGPIKKDKLFFFYSQEWNYEKRGQTRQSCVPTTAEVNGDWSGPEFTGLPGHKVDQCGSPQPNIPVALQAPGNPYKFNSISPAGQDILKNFPAPNLTTLLNGNNWAESVTSPINWRQENARVDYNISHTQTLMGRYTQDSWTNNSPNGNAALGLWGDDPWPVLESNWAQPSKQIVLRLTSTIGTTMVNDLEFAYSANRINITPGGTDPGLLAQTAADFPPGYPLALKTQKQGIPTLWGGSIGGYGSGQNLWLIAPWNNSLDIYTVRDDFSKVWSNHTFRFGGFLGWQGKNEDIGATSASEYPQFGAADWDTNVPTGNGAADLLVPGAKWGWAELSTNVNAHIRWRDYELYAADNWKVRRNLTLDLGLRYSILAPPFQPSNIYTNFAPSTFNPALPSSDACNGIQTVPGMDPCGAANALFGTNFTSGTPGPNKSLKYTNYHLFAPRIGLSWDPWGNGNTAIRAGFGQFFQRDRVSGPFYTLAGNAPIAVSGSFNRTLDSAPATTFPSGGASPSGGVDPANTAGNSLQWNLTVEHGFAKNTTLEVGYVGNHAVHQLNNYNINTVPQSLWLPAAFLNTNTTPNINNLRTYPGWNSMVWWLNNGDATYHALQILFKTQIQKFQLQAAYTYSHSIGDITNTNSDGGLGWQSYTFGANPGLDRGNTGINRPQIFVANAVYYLPELRGQKEIVQSVAGGWEVAAITQYASGTSTTFFQNAVGDDSHFLVPGASGTLNALYGVGFGNNVRPLVSGQGCSANTSGAQVINQGAVTLVGYQIGTFPANTEPRGYCPGPGLVNTDFSVDKNWRVWGERMRIQFRMDFFNLFNHANFRGDQIGGVQGGSSFSGVNCGPANGAGLYQPCSITNNIITRDTPQTNLGTAYLTRGGREIQYGLKIIF